MPVKNMQPSTSVVGGKIYVIGGWHAIGEWNPQWEALTRVDVYDPTMDTWTRKADMPTGRGHTNACVVDGKIYVIGGDSGPGDSPIPTVEVYDPVTDSWTQKDDMPTRRRWFSTCVVDGIIYVIGGNSQPVHLTTVEAYDPMTDTWTTKADMFTGRSFLATCVVDGLIYAIGGGAAGKVAVEVYDPTTDTWTKKADMPTARYGLDAVVVAGKIYAIGGWYFSLGGPIYSTVEVYDTATDTWTKGLDIPVTTAMHSTSVVDGNIYVFGGATATHDNNNWILTSAVYANEPIVDFNGDGIVDIADLRIIVDHWGKNYPLCDIGPMPSGDGIVDVLDLVVLTEYIEPIDRTLIAHWELEEIEGDMAQDCTVGDNDADVFGGPTWQPDGGKAGGALHFDGIDDYVSTPFVLNPGEVSFSAIAWIRGGALGQVIISQADVEGQSATESGSTWLGINSSDGKLMTGLMEIFFGPLESESVVADEQWHHVGLVYDLTAMKRHLYVDGAEVAIDDGIVAGVQSTAGLYIGAGQTLDAGSFFSGLIDDVRIYDVALTPEQIAALAQ